LAAPTSSSNGPRPSNRAARWSLGLALLALAAIPAAAAVTEWRSDLRLIHAGFAVPVAAILAVAAIVLAGRARRRLERTLGRAGGERAARAGRVLGWLALYLVLTASISLGVYAIEYYNLLS
jgi:type IV secretory pathway VirB2 component (pilin)